MINQRQLEADNYINYAAYCTSHSPHPVIIPLFRRPSQSCCHNLAVTISAETANSAVSCHIADFLLHYPSAVLQQGAECDISQPGVCVFGASYNVKICPKDKWIKAGKKEHCFSDLTTHAQCHLLRPAGHMLTIRHVQSRCVYLKWRNADGSSSARLHRSF